jgi:hypothetical protein
MKLGVSYSIFEGTELLEYSIKQIREYVDFIVLNYQSFSWYGLPIQKEDLNNIIRLKNNKLVDELNCFTIQTYAKNSQEARLLEKQKRNIGRNICYESGCNYFLDIDVDEFYKKEEFLSAKNNIRTNGFNYSVVHYVNYYKLPTYQAINKTNLQVPFICKLDPQKQIGEGHGKFVINSKFVAEDLTRGYDTQNDLDAKGIIFEKEKILMHHMTGVRSNIDLKFKTTSGTKINNEQKVINDIKNINNSNLKLDSRPLYRTEEDIKIVPNYFDIPLELFKI